MIVVLLRAIGATDLARAARAVRGAGAWLALVPLPTLLAMSLDAWAWRRLLLVLGRSVSWRRLLELRLSVESIVLALPGGSLGAVPATDAVTVSLWVRRDGTGVGYPRILSWYGDGLDLGDVAGGDNLGVYTSVLGWQATGTPFGTGFHHVAVTGGAGTVTVYFDGAPVYATALNLNLFGQLSIGTRWDGVESWSGAFDQVRVYDRALTADEILKLAQE